MAATSQLLTLEDYERLPDSDEVQQELSDGELIVSPIPDFTHSEVAAQLAKALFEVEKLGFRVYLEAGFRLGPQTLRGPDLSVIRAARRRREPGEKWISGAPEIAVEIVSPSNSAADLQQKIKQYLAAGAIEVWVIYPKTQTVVIYAQSERARELSANDEITCALFPGWACSVAALFE